MDSGFPMRINKYLAHKNLATRKSADALIKVGKVFINKKRAVLGDKVNESDQVEIKNYNPQDNLKYFAYYKPSGVITHSPQKNEVEIISKIREKLPAGNFFPIGRLDKNSHGLIIVTNDGRITDKLLNPNFYHEKEYVVKTKKPIRQSFKEKAEAGMQIENYKTKPCKVRIIDKNVFAITLTEGKKHQIKRMVVANFNEVTDLKRVRIMNIKLLKQRPNQLREITGPELDKFLKALGLKS